MVRSPVMVPRSEPLGSILVLLKVMVGYFSASRKLDDRRSLSRCSLWVRMLAVLIVASAVDRSGCSTSMAPLAVTSAKWPRTVIMPRCLAENSTCVWKGSNFQVLMSNGLLSLISGGSRLRGDAFDYQPTGCVAHLFLRPSIVPGPGRLPAWASSSS